jgi:Zn-dependent M28 family amino/carboxypeptidase
MIYLVRDDLLAALFAGQKISPAMIEEKGAKKYKTYQLEDVTVETRFPVVEESELSLKNVVAWVQGSDPELSKEYITVGAHLDHVALPGDAVANGADDNASGSAGVLEIAEAVALNPPRRSVVFITYTAEEMGLQGSHYFVNAGPLAPGDMKFNVNLDMIGRTTEENRETRAHYVLGASKYEEKLPPFISRINENSVKWPLIYDFKHSYSGSSDHASYSDKGIPSFFFFSGSHEDLHQAGDDPEKIEYDKVEQLSRLAYLITMELANMDQVPDFLDQSSQ